MLPEVQWTPLLLINLVSAVITLTIAILGYRSFGDDLDPTTASFLGIVGAVSLWSAARLFELLFVSETLTRFWIVTIYIGWPVAGISVLLFGLAYTGRTEWLTRRVLAGLFAPCVVALALAATNQYHGLFWTGEFVQQSGWWGEAVVLEREFLPAFDIYMLYIILCTLAGVLIAVRMALTSPDLYRRQVAAISAGALAVLATGTLFGLGIQPVVPQFFDLTPAATAFLAICYGYALYYDRLLDIVPVARNTVIDSMRDGYVVLDEDDRIVDCNLSARNLLGEDSLVGRAIRDVLPEIDDVLAAHEESGHAQKELDVGTGQDRRILLANVSSLGAGAESIGRLLLLGDVTERHAVQRRYQALIEHSSDLIMIVDEDGTITYGSPSIETVTGVPPAAIEGENAFELIHPDDREAFEALYGSLVGDPGGKVRKEYRSWDASGEIIYFEASIWNLLDNPYVEGIVVNAREITDRKARERELETKNEELERANDRLEQFAGVVSHDLRNPINVARGHLDLAREDPDVEHFDTIDESLSHMEAIIEDVLTLARQGETIGEPEPVALEAVTRDAWNHVETDGADLEVSEGTVKADRDRLVQVLENLFRNACEHAGDSPQVEVGLSEDTLYVEDDGPGIDDKRKDAVFEHGHTTNRGGTGLGLSIVDGIAEAHGWDVHVTDGSDGGARFEFSGIELP